MALSTYDDLKRSIASWLNRSDLDSVIPDFITLAEARLNDRLRLMDQEKSTRLTLTTVSATRHRVWLTDEETGAILTDETTGDPLESRYTTINPVNDFSGRILLDDNGEFIVDQDGNALLSDDLGTPVSIVGLPSDFLEMRHLVVDSNPRRQLKLASSGWGIHEYSGLSGYPNIYSITGNTLSIFPATSFDVTLFYYAKIPPLSTARRRNWLLEKRPNIYLYASLLESAPYLHDDTRAIGWVALLDQAILDAHTSDTRGRWGNSGFYLQGPTP